MAAGAVILICDDEPSVRDLMRLSLGAHHQVAEAADGAEAIELAERIHPDLVLLDVMMPGTTGLDVLEHLRADPELAAAPVVVVSAHATERDRLAAFEAGATEFVASRSILRS